MFEILINKITSVLRANTLIGIVYNYEAPILGGDPSAVVVPSSNDGDYETFEENRRVYAFTIRLYVKRSKPREKDDADRILREIVDSVLDDFDKDYTFTGLDVPAGYTFINVLAAPSSWGYAGRDDEYRACEINLRCKVQADVNSMN